MAKPNYFPFIHNEWVKTYKTININNPFNNDTIGRVYLADDDFLEMAIESALKGFKISKELSGYERYDYLMKIAQGLEKNQDKFSETIVLESGKPIRFARNEVNRALLTFTWAAEEARRLGGEVLSLDVSPQTAGYYGITKRFPLGVILGISPFNFPLNLVAHKVAPALASGNSIILKPSSATPLTALLLAEIIKESGLPEGIVNVIPTSGKNAEMLVKDGRIRKLSFTGSAALGWYLKSIAGKKHITLELGGNAAVIVEPDVDWVKIVPRLVLGSFAYAGQTCISIQRIYVHHSIFQDFLKKFIEDTQISGIYGDPMNEKVITGPMIDLESAKKSTNWVEEALNSGAKILTGGKRTKNLMQPTVLTNTTPDMKVISEEVFAPVVAIEPYQQFNDAMIAVNNSHYGLQAGLFTYDLRKIQLAYKYLEVGGVIINDYPTFRVDPMPYGGTKDSGLGREGIRYTIEEMTEPKLLVINGKK
jgi:glyceraldehyde-3-phosphate dehydrogenase (NADP+)